MSGNPKYIDDSAIIQTESSVMGDAEYIAERTSHSNVTRHLRYGFNRRLLMIQHSRIELFKLINEQGDQPILAPALVIPTMQLNSFYTNIIGCLDNLAWTITYLYELVSPVKEEAGKGSSRRFANIVGDEFLEALHDHSIELSKELLLFKPWIDDVKNLRDPGAHRIPITLIPSFLNQHQQKEYQDLYKKYYDKMQEFSQHPIGTGIELIGEAWDYRLEAEKLGTFKPYIVVEEGSTREAKYAPETIINDHWNLMAISKSVLKVVREGI